MLFRSGGAGGSVTAGTIIADGIIAVAAGDGGFGGVTGGIGGAIGSDTFKGSGGVTFVAGNGGNTSAGTGGAGGAVTTVTVNTPLGAAVVHSGSAGSGDDKDAGWRGSSGGDITGLTISMATTVGIFTGDGTSSTIDPGTSTGIADGGRCGNIGKLTTRDI